MVIGAVLGHFVPWDETDWEPTNKNTHPSDTMRSGILLTSQWRPDLHLGFGRLTTKIHRARYGFCK